MLDEMLRARWVLRVEDMLYRPAARTPLALDLAGDVLRRVLGELLALPTHAARVRQAANVEALAALCIEQDPAVVAEAFWAYDKAVKASGSFSLVRRLAQHSLRAASRLSMAGGGQGARRALELRGHARICGISWTDQRVGALNQAAEGLETARGESALAESEDNLAFIDKCQGRLSRLRAEQRQEQGDQSAAAQLYQQSEEQLRSAYQQFAALVRAGSDRLDEEPGECLALLARTHLSAGALNDAEQVARDAHRELDFLQPRRKAWADVCLLDGEIALQRARAEVQGDPKAARAARSTLLGHLRQAQEIVDAFSPVTPEGVLDVGASEVAARAHRQLGVLHEALGDHASACAHLRLAAALFRDMDDTTQAYCCLAMADQLEYDEPLPAALLEALDEAGADPGTRVEAACLHRDEPAGPNAPRRHWAGLVTRGKLIAAGQSYPWADRVAG